MGILNQLLSWGSGHSDYSAPHELRAIWNDYSDQWPENNERYECWKPASVLPAPKWAVKRAMKLRYAEWPEPIDWNVFSAFFMEFADLALHLPQGKYDAIANFRKRRISCCGKEDKHDPLLPYRPSSALAASYQIEQCNQEIIEVRDGLRPSVAWEPVDVNDHELDVVRRILVESTADFASLIQEWRFYILSIGRDQYIAKT
ncbi:MAG: hypothetical protein NTW96_07480 [Planctomycetia bacterium]|nr:hypothetical protein [Planctomycetia bacterium]